MIHQPTTPIAGCTALEYLFLPGCGGHETATWSLLVPRIVEACPNLRFLGLGNRDVPKETQEYLKAKGLDGT